MAARKKRAARRPAADDLALDVESIQRLVDLVVRHDLSELEIEAGPDRRVRIVRGQMPLAFAPPAPPAAASGTAPAAPEAQRAGPAEEGPAEQEAASDTDVVEFPSPLVGTFYRSPSPDADPYVRPGDRVDEDKVLCIIEAMKVMNEIKAGMKGEIVDVLVDNGEAVEYGQPLFRIRRLG